MKERAAKYAGEWLMAHPEAASAKDAVARFNELSGLADNDLDECDTNNDRLAVYAALASGAILLVNSTGGSSAALQRMFRELQAFAHGDPNSSDPFKTERR